VELVLEVELLPETNTLAYLSAASVTKKKVLKLGPLVVFYYPEFRFLAIKISFNIVGQYLKEYI
jgi:hypothetical protein